MRILLASIQGLAGLLLAAGVAAQALQTYSIGTLGATIPAGNWERRTINPSLGPDQFLRADRSYYMVFIETFRLYEQRVDFIDGLELFFAGVEARLADAEIDPEVDYERLERFTRATRRVKAQVSGIAIAYRIDLVSAGDGVGYIALSWCPESEAAGLEGAIESTIAGLELPGTDSEWAARATPSPHSYSFDDFTVELTFRDSVFSELEPKAGQRYSLSANDGSLAVHLFLEELEGDADDALEQIQKVTARDRTYEELTRSDLSLEVGSGQQLLLRSDGDPTVEMAIAAIDVGDGRWIDLRMASTDRAGHRDDLWDGLLRSLRVIKPEDIDAYPVVSEPPKLQSSYLDPPARELLGGKLVATTRSQAVQVRPEGGLLVTENRRLTLIADDATQTPATEALYDSEEYLAGALVPWNEQTLWVDRDGQVSFVARQSLEPAGFRAAIVTAAGDGLLLARNGSSQPLFGLANLPAVGSAQIVSRDNAGNERVLLELSEQSVTALAYRPSDEALVATKPRGMLASSVEGPHNRLLMVGTRKGTSREVGLWDRVVRLEPASDGWLVTGKPAEGPKGVYSLDDRGNAELLLGGDAIGIALAGDELWLVTERCLEPKEDYFQHCVYRVPVSQARQVGRAFQPFDTEVLNQVAGRLASELETRAGASFSSREGIGGLIGAADRVAVELTGAHLPLSSDGLDDLLDRLTYDRDLSPAGARLVSVMLAESLLRRGAEWVTSTEASRPARGTSDWEEENAFAVGVDPESAVLSTLYEEDGWYSPASEILEQANGRALFLGVDASALRERVRDARLEELPRLLREARVARVIALLEEAADNVYLRELVYKELAAWGHQQEVADVAEPFATRDDANGVDLVAWMAGRLANDHSESEIDRAISDLRKAIEKAPGEAALYLLLGATYERSARPNRRTLAEACYRKAQEEAPWGELKTSVEESLARIADEN